MGGFYLSQNRHPLLVVEKAAVKTLACPVCFKFLQDRNKNKAEIARSMQRSSSDALTEFRTRS